MSALGWLVLIVGGGYVVSVWVHPLRRCRACGGDGKFYGSLLSRTYRECRRCRGRGGYPRWGTAVLGNRRR